jgi:ABC-type multidrug transport system permease subunit
MILLVPAIVAAVIVVLGALEAFLPGIASSIAVAIVVLGFLNMFLQGIMDSFYPQHPPYSRFGISVASSAETAIVFTGLLEIFLPRIIVAMIVPVASMLIIFLGTLEVLALLRY